MSKKRLRPRHRLEQRRSEGRGIDGSLGLRLRALGPSVGPSVSVRLGLTFLLALILSGCGIPTVTFIAEPIPQQRFGSELRFEHTSENDTEDFKGYELYYKIYNADDTAVIENDQQYIQAAESPGTARLTNREFLRMVRTETGEPGGAGIEEPPMLPVGSSAKGSRFLITVNFSEAAGTVVVENPGESSIDQLLLYRQNVLLTEQTEATEFDLFLDPAAYQYDPQQTTNNDADLAEMLNDAYDETNRYRAAVVVIAYGVDATDFQRIYSTPVYLTSPTFELLGL